MYNLIDLVKLHISQLDKLKEYEHNLDKQIKIAFEDNPFATSVVFTTSYTTLPKSAVVKLAPLYKNAGFTISVMDWPTVKVTVDDVNQRYSALMVKELEAAKDLTTTERAIKL